MPNQESDMFDLLSARCLATWTSSKVAGRCRRRRRRKRFFTISTPFDLFTSKQVPQGVVNATAYFQGITVELLAGPKCKIWVDGVFFSGDELLDTLNATLTS